MSRIGKLPIEVPASVDVQVESGVVRVKGPKGELSQRISPDLTLEREDSQLLVKRPTDRKDHRALHGLTRSLINNMVTGVTEGFEKRLEIQGVGYRAQLRGKGLELALGYSHPVKVEAPEGIEFEVPMPTQVIVRGIDKQVVGEIAARIRKARPPEPYKGKGIRYAGEQVSRKVGKRAEGRCDDDGDDRKVQTALPPQDEDPWKGARHFRTPSALRLPFKSGDLCPADRRRGRPYAGLRQLDGAGATFPWPDGEGEAGGRAAGRTRPRGRSLHLRL
jgi:large subunit ribosomal protein L6